MSKKSKVLKGFTLIELIIVMAIFSVIMVLVMSLVDPVSKLMSKTSLRERTASYADNIGTYVDKSIRYAQFLRVFENDFCNKDDGTDQVSEEAAVLKFVEDFFDGAVDATYSPLTGKVHVLKLINTDTGSLEAGKIYESVYEFSAGDTYYELSTRITHPGEYNATVNLIKSNEMVLNEEHFTEYSYFYKLGTYDMEAVSLKDGDDYLYHSIDSDGNITGDIEPDSNAKYYYSKLVERYDNNGSKIQMGNNATNFVLNIVSYQIGNSIDTIFNSVNGDVQVTLFKSPAQLFSAGMTLKNVYTENFGVRYYRYKQKLDASGKVVREKNSDDEEYLEPVVYYSDTYNRYVCTLSDSQNIYLIYTNSDETADSAITQMH